MACPHESRSRRTAGLRKAPRKPLKSARCLLKNPARSAPIVVTKRQVVVQRGEAMRLALLLHLLELAAIEVWFFDGAPVVGGGIHGEAGTESAIHADDHVVLPGAAIPILKFAVHELTHIH